MEVQCGEVKDGKGGETLMKGFTTKVSMSDGLTRGRRREDSKSKSFLGRILKGRSLVIRDEVGSVDSFGWEVQE